MPFYGRFKTKCGTWRTVGPCGYDHAEDTARFFAGDREWKIITEEEFMELLRKGEISET